MLSKCDTHHNACSKAVQSDQRVLAWRSIKKDEYGKSFNVFFEYP